MRFSANASASMVASSAGLISAAHTARSAPARPAANARPVRLCVVTAVSTIALAHRVSISITTPASVCKVVRPARFSVMAIASVAVPRSSWTPTRAPVCRFVRPARSSAAASARTSSTTRTIAAPAEMSVRPECRASLAPASVRRRTSTVLRSPSASRKPTPAPNHLNAKETRIQSGSGSLFVYADSSLDWSCRIGCPFAPGSRKEPNIGRSQRAQNKPGDGRANSRGAVGNDRLVQINSGGLVHLP